MNMLKEFKEFAMRGNVVDMAVGIIIGGAFGKIVSSMVSDVLMPAVGLILGRISFANLFVPLNGQHYGSLEAAKAAGAPVLPYGLFINTVMDFVIVAFCLFLIIKLMNRLNRKEAQAPAAPPADVALLGEIRDLLKERR
jgi:large conductance mechanosensitive channel